MKTDMLMFYLSYPTGYLTGSGHLIALEILKGIYVYPYGLKAWRTLVHKEAYLCFPYSLKIILKFVDA